MVNSTANVKTRGFTLVELMIALALSLFLLGGTILLASSGTGSARDAERMARAQESLRFISNFFVQELRMTGSFPMIQNPPTTFFTSIPDDNGRITSIIVRYQARTNCLGQSTDTNESLGIATNTYFLDGNRLRCDGGEQEVGTMLDGVADLAFREITASDRVLGLKIDVSLVDDPFPDITYSFAVAFRNPVIREAF